MVEPTDGQIKILLAEDNLADVKLLQECLPDLTFPYHLSLVSDGEAALAFLEQRAPYLEAPRPHLILLDVHLIKKSGWEILEWARAIPSLATLPIVILAGILSPADEKERDRLQPTRCLLKPDTIEGYRDMVKVFAEVIRHNTSAAPRSRSLKNTLSCS